MKRIFLLLLVAIMLCGCQSEQSSLSPALKLRSAISESQGCSFTAKITADYGEEYYTFTVFCQYDAQDQLTFDVKEPETISGITGVVTGEKGEITFDGKALAFATLADGYLSPVSSPWVMIHSLESGYLTSCGKDEQYYRVAVDDSYEDDALHLDVWLDEGSMPVRCEILYKGRRYLTIDVREFVFL